MGGFECKDCDFIGENLETMEVHLGKCFVDQYYCGLCDWNSDDLLSLETHLAACEIYSCVVCEERCKALGDIKLHIEEKHGKNKHLYHLKMNRICSRIVDRKKYSYSDV